MPLLSKLLKGAPVNGVHVYRVHAVAATTQDFHVPLDGVTLTEETEQETPLTAARASSPDLPAPGQADLSEELIRVRVEIRKEMEQERQEAVEAGFKEGYNRGYGEGKEQAETSYFNLLKEAEEYLSCARQNAREIVAASEQTVVELAVAVAETLLRSQLELAPEKVLEIVKEAVGSLPEGDQVKIFINPRDLPVCLRYREEIEGSLNQFKHVEVVPELEMSRGSCRVESESSCVEFLLEEEKVQLKEALLEIARKENAKYLREEKRFYGEH